MKLVAHVLCCTLLIGGCSLPVYTYGEVPFVPTPPEVIDRMLAMAEVENGDILYDVGSGDGRIVITAAKRYGIKGVGIEIDDDLVREAQTRARRENVQNLVEFRAQDALTADVSPATVVTIYMLPEFNAKLRPLLERQLKPGTRVVSHDFPIEGWVPIRTETLPGGILHEHTLFLFQIGSTRATH
jgi:ubiquinone/menaquinone biosynthesis C-methylase UbiE